MTKDVKKFENLFLGKPIAVTRDDQNWLFRVSGIRKFRVETHWRLTVAGRIVFGSEDEGHKFGLEHHLDGENIVNEILSDNSILRFDVDMNSADIHVDLSDNIAIDIFNLSAGYEGWEIEAVIDGQRLSLIAWGGGELGVHSQGLD